MTTPAAEVAPPARRTGALAGFAALAAPDFRRLWLGQAISQVGDGIAGLAIILLLNQLTGSARAIALYLILGSLPQLAVGLLAGVFADRWDRRRTMIGADILRGVIVLGLVFVRSPHDVWLVYTLGIASATVGTVFNPAKSALVPALVAPELLLAANALSTTTMVTAGVIGAGLAGVLMGTRLGPWPAFVLDSLSFFASAAFIARVRAPAVARAVARASTRGRPRARILTAEVLGDLRRGITVVFGNRTLTGVLIALAIAVLGTAAVSVLFVPYLVNVLRVPPAAVGLARATQTIGLVAMAAVITALATRVSPAVLFAGGVATVGATLLVLGAAHAFVVVLAVLVVTGCGAAALQSGVETLLQTSVEPALRGRADSALDTILMGASLASMAAAGLAADAWGIRAVFLVAGGLVLAAGGVARGLVRRAPPC